MIANSAPIHAPGPAHEGSARYSLSGKPDRRADGAMPLPPGGIAPTCVSTATNLPMTVGKSLLPSVPVAVLTLFEGQAVFRVVASDTTDLPRNMLFRLRKGLRDVPGGTQ